MPASPAAAAVGTRKEIQPLVLAAQFEKELLRQRQFGATWGELVAGGVPTTLDESIAAKRAQIARLREQTGAGARNAAYTTTTARSYPPRTGASQLGDLETGLGKAYKVLRAGI